MQALWWLLRSVRGQAGAKDGGEGERGRCVREGAAPRLVSGGALHVNHFGLKGAHALGREVEAQAGDEEVGGGEGGHCEATGLSVAPTRPARGAGTAGTHRTGT